MFIDDYICYTWLSLLKRKLDFFDCFLKFQRLVWKSTEKKNSFFFKVIEGWISTWWVSKSFLILISTPIHLLRSRSLFKWWPTYLIFFLHFRKIWIKFFYIIERLDDLVWIEILLHIFNFSYINKKTKLV